MAGGGIELHARPVINTGTSMPQHTSSKGGTYGRSHKFRILLADVLPTRPYYLGSVLRRLILGKLPYGHVQSLLHGIWGALRGSSGQQMLAESPCLLTVNLLLSLGLEVCKGYLPGDSNVNIFWISCGFLVEQHDILAKNNYIGVFGYLHAGLKYLNGTHLGLVEATRLGTGTSGVEVFTAVSFSSGKRVKSDVPCKMGVSNNKGP